MFHFAICEDERPYLEYLSEEIQTVFRNIGSARGQFSIEPFNDSSRLLDTILSGKQYDVLFLDIVMPGVDGFELCRQLRAREAETLVIFISSKEELVFQSFAVQPFNFLRKNYVHEELPAAAREILQRLRRQRFHQLTLREPASGRVFTLPLKDILYVEAQLRYSHIRLRQEELNIRLPFREMEDTLLPLGFLKVHRSYLVNYRCIHRIDRQELSLSDGSRIPISRGRTGVVKMEFMEWAGV
ncbi:MAG: LytR/AlgR family response regulator transcription factor [Oribacterium sp.]